MILRHLRSRRLIRRAMAGRLDTGEIARLAKRLEQSSNAQEQIDILHVLGEAGARTYYPDVVKTLRATRDPFVAKAALDTVALHWGKVEDDLRPDINSLIHGASWDDDGWARSGALIAAGYYLRHTDDPEILQHLIEIVQSQDEEIETRELAYMGISIAMREQEPTASLPRDPATDGLLLEARARASE